MPKARFFRCKPQIHFSFDFTPTQRIADLQKATFRTARIYTLAILYRPAITIIAASFLCSSGPAKQPVPPAKMHDVDVFLGADGGGHTTPGAQVPFGFVSLQPDTEHPNSSGYRSGERVIGFSSTHVSGTGGSSKYGNFCVTPSIGTLGKPSSQVGSDEEAWPGYYAVTLDSRQGRIRAELTASRLVGFQRYTFPRDRTARLMIDVSSVIVNSGGTPQEPVACMAKTRSDGLLSGTCKFRGGWNPGEYQLYFAAQFDSRPTSISVGREIDVSNPLNEVHTDKRGEKVWAWASFDTRKHAVIQMKLAVSFISIDKAEANLHEVATLDFDRALRRAERQWAVALGRIQIKGGSAAQRALFSSALYRAQVMPHDLSGENTWWRSSEPHYEDYYTLWDTFRTQDPLLTVIQPNRERDMVRSLVDTYRHTGWIPDARIAGSNGLTQGGSNGDVLIADAIVKGVRGIDYQTAYQALVKDADTDSPDPILYGREKVSTYKRLGYLPLSVGRSGSRTMEYAYDDFAIAEVAKALGRPDAAAEFRRRSLFWTNLWDAPSQSVRPRYADGRWLTPFDRKLTTKSWDSPFYEGSPWQYSTYVPHDVQGLINRTGGDAAFVSWLDQFFTGNGYDPGNEPDMLAAWLYIHAGRPDRSQAMVRQLLDKYFKPGRAGLPGNDDAGAMTSWYVWAAMGLYPNAGQAYYYIGAPVFTKVRIKAGRCRFFTIEARRPSPINLYIQSARLNGHPLDRAWLKHSELMAGGILDLQMGPQPSTWGNHARPDSVEDPQ